MTVSATKYYSEAQGMIRVAAGTRVSVRNAYVTAIMVDPGGYLDVEGSSISMSIVASSPGAIRVCGSVVKGSVTVTSSAGFVLVGDPAGHGCATNTIGGALMLMGNHHGVVAVNNKVAMAVVNSGSSGTGVFQYDTAPVVTGNRP